MYQEIKKNISIENYRLRLLKVPYKIFFLSFVPLVFALVVTLLFLDSFLQLKDTGEISGTYFGVFNLYTSYVLGLGMFLITAMDFAAEYEKKTIHHHFLNNSNALSYILSKWIIYTLYAFISYIIAALFAYGMYLLYTYGNWENVDLRNILVNFMYIWMFVSLAVLVGVYSGSAGKALLWGLAYFLGIEHFTLFLLEKTGNVAHTEFFSNLSQYSPFNLLARLATSVPEQAKYYFFLLGIFFYFALFLYIAYWHLSRKELATVK